MEKPVELYFVESWTTPYLFPSKIGGYPFWLRRSNLPNRTVLVCQTCGNPLTFFLQIYSHNEMSASAYHRTLFLFICVNGKCYRQSENQHLVVLRSQLPQENDFYSDDAREGDEITSPLPSTGKYQPMCCSVSGCTASLECPEVDCCCEDHRDYDYQTNNLSVFGEIKEITPGKKTRNYYLLREYDLVMEPEVLPPTETEKSDEEKMKEFSRFMKSSKAPKEIKDLPLDEFDALTEKHDKTFNKFKKRIKLEPEQVLRYQRGGTPLWVSSEHVPTEKDIPDCVCGSKRIFEFQVMPQLLNYLSLDSLEDSVDWGTLAVYTCSKSCENGEKGYVKEFVWKQDFSYHE